ncbi:MAG: hypothetical protein U0234_01250 [Sandaracinus sp.]
MTCALSVGCATSPTEPVRLTDVHLSASALRSAGDHFALVEGVEASSDPSEAGITVRALDLDGNEILRAPVDGGVRGLALTSDAVATLELTSTLADQHLVIRPLFGGDPVLVPHRFPPIALAASGAQLLFVEARVLRAHDDDGDGVAETSELGLELVEVETDGSVHRRTEVALEGGLRAPASALEPFPRVFDLVATGDRVYLGWGSLLCGGHSEVLAIDRDTGAATVAWRGAAAAFDGTSCTCASTADNVTEMGEALVVVDGVLTVAGSVYSCASVSADAGFLASGASTRRLAEPLLAATAGTGGVLVADREAVYEVGAVLVERAPSPRGERVESVRWEGRSPRRALVATNRGVYRFDL